MKRFFVVFGMLFGLGVFLGSCAFILTEPIDFESLPKPIDVSTTNQFFTEAAIKFTGNPLSDFGSSYLFLNKDDGGTTEKVGKVFVAYSKRYLFIGHKNTVDSPDAEEGAWKRGAFYIFIDNGITNGNGSKGKKKLSNEDDGSGVSGGFDSFDSLGTETVGDRKFSVYIKHYRPWGQIGVKTAEDLKAYTMVNGVIQKDFVRGDSGSLSWQRYLTNGVTEVAIPWSFIFGNNPEYIPDKIYLEFRIDDAAFGNQFSGADFGTNMATTNIISNWLELRIK